MGGERVPAILDLSPYRAFDVFRALEEPLLPWWAARGYAVLAVDAAGSGGSTGILRDEYLDPEIDDAVAAVAWAARQPWCDGGVGLSGLSWAAFVALRAAARRPPALKAMALGGVSEDGWATEIHNLGGQTYAARVDWAGVMLMFNALPPDPKQVGDGWRAAWMNRLEANTPWIGPWLSHPERDAFWQVKAAPMSETPLLLYSGWADKYATSVLRIAAAWKGPVRTIIGPWEHATPTTAERGPRIGFLQEALAWWDYWLKSRRAGAKTIMDAPPLRLWLAEPDREGRLEAGAWRAMDWPMQGARSIALHVAGDGRLVTSQAGVPGRLTLTPAPMTPTVLGADLYEDAPGPWPADGAFLSDAFEHDLDIVAAPVLTVRLASDGLGGLLVARLLDVAPDGRAVRMTTAAVNLAFAAGGGEAAPAAPGEEIQVTLPFQAIAWRLKAGHRLGLALSADGWPTLWPGRAGATLTLARESLRLALPMAVGDAPGVRPFAGPETAPGAALGPPKWLDPAKETLPPTGLTGGAAHEPAAYAYHLAATGTDYRLASRFELKLEAGGREACAAKVYRVAFERPGWSIRVETRLLVRSTPAAFNVTWSVKALEGGKVVFDRDGEDSVPRSIV
jgi:putative CocE/NonD family hydrolase